VGGGGGSRPRGPAAARETASRRRVARLEAEHFAPLCAMALEGAEHVFRCPPPFGTHTLSMHSLWNVLFPDFYFITQSH